METEIDKNNMAELERVLEDLVNRCNYEIEASTWQEVISAEAALERIYKARKAAMGEAK